MSFFGTNPLSTPVGSLIDRATDISGEDSLQLFYEIADLIDLKEENAKDAVKAIRKKLSIYGGRNWTVVTKLLELLELCATNCTKRFHLQLAQKDFLQDLKNLIGPKLQPPLVIQEKVLFLIQAWTNQFRNDSDLRAIEAFYYELRNKGIDFPAVDQTKHLLPEASQQATQNEVPTPSAPSTNTMRRETPPRQNQPQVTAAAAVATPPQQQQQQSQSNIIPINASTVVTLTPEQCGKLNSELDVVESNVQVFNEVLNQLQTINITKLHEEYKADIELLRDLHRTCNEMQTRITQLITSITNENVIDELLRINDDLNNVFLRYERFERSLPQGVSAVSPLAASSNTSTQNNASATSDIQRTPVNSNNVYSRNMRAEARPVVEDKPLIDFGDDNNAASNDVLTKNAAKLSISPPRQQLSPTNAIENNDGNAFLNDQNEIQEMENWLRSQGDDLNKPEANEYENYLKPREGGEQQQKTSTTPSNRQVKTDTKSMFSL